LSGADNKIRQNEEPEIRERIVGAYVGPTRVYEDQIDAAKPRTMGFDQEAEIRVTRTTHVMDQPEVILITGLYQYFAKRPKC